MASTFFHVVKSEVINFNDVVDFTNHVSSWHVKSLLLMMFLNLFIMSFILI